MTLPGFKPRKVVVTLPAVQLQLVGSSSSFLAGLGNSEGLCSYWAGGELEPKEQKGEES